MVIHKLKVLNNYCATEAILIVVFLLPQLLDIFSFGRLIYLRSKISNERILTTGFTFLKVKLVLLYIFGVGYLFHSGMYVWKHTLPEDCPDNSLLDCAYEVFSMIYIFIIFVYFALFYNTKPKRNITEHYIILSFIVIANVCIWLNAILFASDFLDEKKKNLNKAESAIKKIDTFCSPAMVEFSLMVIDMILTENHTVEGSSKWKLHTKSDKIKSRKNITLIIIHIALSVLVLAFFAFVFTVVLITDSDDKLIAYPEYFNIYFSFELILKVIMLALLNVCLYLEWKYLAFHLNLSSIVLCVTCTGNVAYHILYCFVIIIDDIKTHTVSYICPLIVNAISIIIAILQTMFIIGIHSKHYIRLLNCHQCLPTKCLHTKCVYYVCYVLGVFNLGLWISDSIGEDRRAVFSFVYYQAIDCKALSIILTAIFPVTIFFRFQTGLDFLKFFWEQETIPNKRRHSDSELNNWKVSKSM